MNNLKGEYLGTSTTIIQEVKEKMKGFASTEITHEKRSIETHSLAKVATTLPYGRHLGLVNRPEIICIPENI